MLHATTILFKCWLSGDFTVPHELFPLTTLSHFKIQYLLSSLWLLFCYVWLSQHQYSYYVPLRQAPAIHEKPIWLNNKRHLEDNRPPTSFFTVIMRGIKLGIIIGKLDAGNDKVILLIRCVSTQHQPVHAVILSLWPGMKTKEIFIIIYWESALWYPCMGIPTNSVPRNIRKPLSSKAGPL